MNQNFLILQNFIPRRSGVVKLLISSQIFNATENFWILPNFILCRSAVVKNRIFEPNFQHKSKFFLILQNFILCRSGVVKLLISSQIFNVTENFWILPNFILHRSGVVKNLIFEPNFQHKSKFFWILSNFILPGLLSGEKCQFWAKFQQLSKFLDFAKFHPSKIQSGQKCQFWAKFSRRLKISGFSQISSFAGPEWSNSQFKPNFHRDWKFLNFAKLHLSHVLSGQKCQFWAKFSTWLKYVSILPKLSLPRSRVVKNVNFDPNLKRNWKFLDFAKFHPLQADRGQKCLFWAKFSTWLKNVCILPNFSLPRSRVVKNVNFDPNFNWD